MTSKEFLLQRICIYAGKPVDPNSDIEVSALLRDKFNIRLPQRPSFIESLQSTTSTHEILDLIVKYRTTEN